MYLFDPNKLFLFLVPFSSHHGEPSASSSSAFSLSQRQLTRIKFTLPHSRSNLSFSPILLSHIASDFRSTLLSLFISSPLSPYPGLLTPLPVTSTFQFVYVIPLYLSRFPSTRLFSLQITMWPNINHSSRGFPSNIICQFANHLPISTEREKKSGCSWCRPLTPPSHLQHTSCICCTSLTY